MGMVWAPFRGGVLRKMKMNRLWKKNRPRNLKCMFGRIENREERKEMRENEVFSMVEERK